MAVYLAWINFGLNCFILVFQIINLSLIIRNGKLLKGRK